MGRRHADFTTPDEGFGGYGEQHTFYSKCAHYAHWCRIHQTRVWNRYSGDKKGNSVRFPEDFSFVSSREVSERNKKGWVTVTVHCGPGAFYPKREEMKRVVRQ